MKFFRYLLLLMLLALLVTGCSKKQEDAAKLEQELLNEDSAGQVMADSAEMAADTGASALDASAIPEEEPPAAMPGQPEGSGYTVQVASCEERSYAEHVIDLYTNRGYEPYLVTVTVDGQIYHRIRIGMFETWQEARALQNDLLSKYSVQSWVDRVDTGF